MLSSLQPPQAPPPAPLRGGLKLGIVTYNIAKDWDIPDDHQEPDRGRVRRASSCGRRTSTAWRLRCRSRPRARRCGSSSRPRRSRSAGSARRASSTRRIRRSSARTSTRRRSGSSWRRTSGRRASRSARTACRKDVPEEKTLEQIGKSLAECGAFARDNGIVIQLEVHGAETPARAAHPEDVRLRRQPPQRPRLLELEPDGSARRRLRRELPAAARPDRPGAHARPVARGVSLEAADRRRSRR